MTLNSFSEYIQKYIKEHELSYTTAAEMCGIDRTTISRYAKGERKMPSEEMLLKIEEGLQMSTEERKCLEEAYKRTRLSEKYHVDCQSIEAIVSTKHRLNPVRMYGIYKIVEEPQEDISSLLFGEDAILAAINHVKKDAAYIKMNFSPYHFKDKEKFKAVFTDMKGIEKREQIVGFLYADWKYAQEKIWTLHCLLPHLMQKEPMKIYYHYKHVNKEDHIDAKEYYLLTDRGIVFFDKNLMRGFFSNEKIPCEYYHTMFDRIKMQCREFAEGGMETYQNFKEDSCNHKWKSLESGILFYEQTAEQCIWMIRQEEKQAVCIKETDSTQLLRDYIWGEV